MQLVIKWMKDLHKRKMSVPPNLKTHNFFSVFFCIPGRDKPGEPGSKQKAEKPMEKSERESERDLLFPDNILKSVYHGW